MKKFIIIAILLISNFGIFGVNTEGEENTNAQEITTNEIVQEINVIKEQSKREENVVQIPEKIKSKQEESKTENKETPKATTKTKKIKNETKVKQETKKTEQKTQESVVTNQKVQETKNEMQSNKTKQCINDKHIVEAGNSKKWFKTEQEAISYYNAETKKWSDMWTNFKISDEEYYKKCPYRL